jgi:hypothetical protein
MSYIIAAVNALAASAAPAAASSSQDNAQAQSGAPAQLNSKVLEKFRHITHAPSPAATSSFADAPIPSAAAPLPLQLNLFKLTDPGEQRQSFLQPFRIPNGRIPHNDGGVAQQMSAPNYNIERAAACNNTMGITADPTDPKCWYWCTEPTRHNQSGRGYRYCCLFDLCWHRPVFLFFLGHCAPCGDLYPPLPPSRCIFSFPFRKHDS